MTAKIVIYTTSDEVPDAHRCVGYLYIKGEAMPVAFRGSSPENVRNKITAFHDQQEELDRQRATKIDGRTKEGKALLKAQKEAA